MSGRRSPRRFHCQQGTASEAKTGSVGAVPPPSQSDDSLITLHADELDVRKVLEMMSRQGSVGMAFSPGVTGKITLDIKNKTLDEALTIIAGLCRLSVRRENDVIYISTAKEVKEGAGRQPARATVSPELRQEQRRDGDDQGTEEPEGQNHAVARQSDGSV